MSRVKIVFVLVIAFSVQGCEKSAPQTSIDVDDEQTTTVPATPDDAPLESVATAAAESDDEEPRTLVYETPEACYAAMVKAAETEDVEVSLSCLDMAGRNQLVGWLAYQVEREAFFQTEKQEAARALLKKNGLGKTDIMGLLQIYDSPGGKGPGKAVELVGAEIKDKPQFTKEATALLSSEEKPPTANERPANPVLTDVKIEGDRAKGVLKLPDSEESPPIFFEKLDGSWVVSSKPTTKQ